jgi:hypothetical protein
MDNMRAQASNHRMQQEQLIAQHETNVSICEVTIASIKKEFGLGEKDGE